MSILKRTIFVQALSYGGDFKIGLYGAEMKTTSYMTAFTLDTIEVEFEVPDYSQDDFKKMRQKELTKVKADIMRSAELRCAALDEKA